MGSTFYYNTTLKQAIENEVGSGWKITDKAVGAYTPDGTWQGATWLVLDPTDDLLARYAEQGLDAPQRIIALALWYRQTRSNGWRKETGHGVKIVDESMGPGTGSIPRRIWDQRGETVPNSFSADWRAAQEKWFEEFPQVATEAETGKSYNLEGYGKVRFVGKRTRGRSVRYLFHFFDVAAPGVYALRTSEHKLGLGPVPAEVLAS